MSVTTQVLAWGYADDGELGVGADSMDKYRAHSPTQGLRDLILGDRAHFIATPTPVKFPLPSVVIARVSAGSRHSLAVDTQGRTYSWGWNKVCAAGCACYF